MAKRYSFGWVDMRETYGVVHDPVTYSLVLADGTRITREALIKMSEEAIVATARDAKRVYDERKMNPPPAATTVQPTSIAPAVPPKIKAPEIDL